MNTKFFTVGAIAWGLLVFASLADADSWVRPIIASDEVFAENEQSDFQLEVVRCDNNHLTVLALLTRYRSKNVAGKPSVIVTGIEADERRFWPNVIAEVSNDLKAGWREIGRSNVRGTSATRRVDSYTPGETLFVDMNIFRPLINQARYGRLALENGEKVVFLMRNLQPLSDSEATDWTREPDELHPEFTSLPFLTRPNRPVSLLLLLATSSDAGGIDGKFSYGIPGGKSGRRVDDWALSKYGNFWPTVTAQVANEDRGKWKTIGTSSKPDKMYKPNRPPKVAELLHVDLSIFRPMIGRYRYGRVMLENGDSAIFELVNLLPPRK